MTRTDPDARPLPDSWPAGTVIVVGLDADRLDNLPPEARKAVDAADVLVGAARQLRAVEGTTAVTVEIGHDVDDVARQVRRRAVDGGQRVCVLAAGDPGFFGITRALTRTIDRRSLRILPAVSPVSLAFARLGLPWDDAAVVATAERPLAETVGAIRTSHKVCVLTSPESPPEALGTALIDAGASFDLVAVCSGMGGAAEEVRELDLAGLAAGRFDPHSVVVLIGPGGLPSLGWAPGAHRPPPAWGLPEGVGLAGLPPAGNWAGVVGTGVVGTGVVGTGVVGTGVVGTGVVGAELRAAVLERLMLPAAGVVWGVGSGGGSVAIGCALARPGLTVLAVEESPEASARITREIASLGAGVHVVTGSAPEALEGLPAPDRAFVGSGDTGVLHAVLGRLRPGGRVVATFAAIDRAAAAAELLGNLVQIGVSPALRLPDGGWTLHALDPVFLAWGP